MVRKVSLSDINDGKDGKSASLPSGGVAAMLSELAKGVDEVRVLTERVDKLDQARIAMTKALDVVQKTVGGLGETAKALQQYTKDHDKLHSDMAKASGDSQKDLIRLVRNVVAQTDIVQDAVKELVLKKDAPIIVDAKAPEVNVEVEAPIVEIEVQNKRGSWDVKFQRDQRGLISDAKLIPVGDDK